MNKPVLNEQQNRTMGKLSEALGEMDLANKKYFLGFFEGYNAGRTAGTDERKTEEKGNQEQEAG